MKLNVDIVLFADSIFFLGTDKHRKVVEDCYKMKIFGAFAMTELGHGSNGSKIETTAEYEETSKTFLFNSPTITPGRAWGGGIGRTANWALIFAQLIVKG